jgi:hypothetical protein
MNKLKHKNILLTKCKQNKHKHHSGAAKFRISNIQKTKVVTK